MNNILNCTTLQDDPLPVVDDNLPLLGHGTIFDWISVSMLEREQSSEDHQAERPREMPRATNNISSGRPY